MVGSGTRARKYRQSETKLQVGRSYAAGQENVDNSQRQRYSLDRVVWVCTQCRVGRETRKYRQSDTLA